MRRKERLLCGVGINDANYVVKPTNPLRGSQSTCPYYRKWKSMIERCYSEKCREKRPTYKGCTVCEEWLTFSNFKQWMEKQNWESKQLDKDILHEGNKVYNPRDCVFVSRMLNMFVLDRGKARGDFMIGVCFDKDNKKFISNCNNPLTKKKEHLGRFNSELEAHLAWKTRKLELVDLLQEQGYIDDVRIYKALKLKYK